MRKIDETGNHYGRWTVAQEAKRAKTGKALWLCRCECGKEGAISGTELRAGKTKSCGCLARDLLAERKIGRTHGLSHHPLYKIWQGIKNRCYNPKYVDYKNYGGRGIQMHEAWLNDAASFVRWIEADLGPRPKGHSLDRMNNNKNYEPGNLRWANAKTQYHNRRVRLVTEEEEEILLRAAEQRGIRADGPSLSIELEDL